MSVTNFDRENFAEIIKDKDGRDYDWFTAHVIRFIDKVWGKADIANRTNLEWAFPDVVDAYKYWLSHGSAFIPEDDR
jgi:hypothetical protein